MKKSGFFAGLMALAAAVSALLGGCSPQEEPVLPEDVTSISCVLAAMDRRQSFSFRLEKEEKAVLLSASCMKEEQEQNLNKVPVSTEEFESLLLLLQEQDGLSLVTQPPRKDSLPEVSDRDTRTLSIITRDGRFLSAEAPSDLFLTMESFFRQLVSEYQP